MAGLLPRAGYRHFDRVCPTKVAFLPTYRERKQQKREVNKNSCIQSGTSPHPKHNDLVAILQEAEHSEVLMAGSRVFGLHIFVTCWTFSATVPSE